MSSSRATYLLQNMVANEQLKVALRSPRFAALVRDANLATRCANCNGLRPRRLETLVITSWNRPKESIARAMSPLGLASRPSIKFLNGIPGATTTTTTTTFDSTFPSSDAAVDIEWSTLKLKAPWPEEMQTLVTTIPTAFPTITELQFFSTAPIQYCLLVCLLHNREWAGRLTSLTIHYYFRGASKEVEGAIVRPLFEALNNGLPALRRLALNWDSEHLVLPDLPVLSRLQVMALNLVDQQQHHFQKEDPFPVYQPEYAPAAAEEEEGGEEEGAPLDYDVQLHQGPPNPPDLAHFFRSLELYAARNTALEVHLLASDHGSIPANLLRLVPALRRRIVRYCLSGRPLDTATPECDNIPLALDFDQLPALVRQLPSLRSLSVGYFSEASLSLEPLQGEDEVEEVSPRLRDLFPLLIHLPQLVHLELMISLAGDDPQRRCDEGANCEVGDDRRGREGDSSYPPASPSPSHFSPPSNSPFSDSVTPTATPANLSSSPSPPPPHSTTTTTSVRALDLHLQLHHRGHEEVAGLGRQLRRALPALEVVHLSIYQCVDCRAGHLQSCHIAAANYDRCRQETLSALYPLPLEEEEEGRPNKPLLLSANNWKGYL